MNHDESITSLIEWLSPKLTTDELKYVRSQLDRLAGNAKRHAYLLERDSHSLYAVMGAAGKYDFHEGQPKPLKQAEK